MIPVQLFLIVLVSALNVLAPGKPQPVITYVLAIDPANLSVIDVSAAIQGAPRTIRLAMAVHPEYDDRFWRYIRDLRAYADGNQVSIAVDSDHSWRIRTRRGDATLRYRIQLPPENPTSRAVWHTTLRADGASINSTDTFIYLPDFPRSPASVVLNIPDSWQVASALTVGTTGSPTPPRVMRYLTGDVTTLLDSPILLGSLRRWTFAINGVPHTVAYWPLPNATPFDTTEFVGSIERFARQAFALYGKTPYPNYTFLIEDGAWGGLEHVGSVSIGAQSSDLAKDPHAYMGEIAHEYFHTWNLVALNPRGLPSASADPPTHTRELWWSEGVTMYYAQALQRRAGMPEEGKTRLQELEEEIDRFYGNSSNAQVSPERGSWASIDPPEFGADYLSNYYTQGRLIAYALDLIIADSTGGSRGIDDAMRSMYDRFAKKKAFTGVDIERAVHDTCDCNVHKFFEDHVRGAKPIDFDPLLAPLGLRVVLATAPVADTAGMRYPDLRISAYAPEAGGRMRVRIMDPRTMWTTAGLHTGMEWISLNRIPIDSFPDFRRAIRSIKLGDLVPVEVARNGVTQQLNVRVTGYDRTRAKIVELPAAAPAQLERRRVWLSASTR